MATSAQPVGDVRVLGRSRIWPAIAIPGAVALTMIVVAVASGYVSFYLAIAVAVSLLIAVLRRGDAVLGDDVGLLVRTRTGLRRSYAWGEIERMGWVPTGMWGTMLQIYPRGGPYDVPGPNSSIDVARIWGPGHRRLAGSLPELLQRHGIKALADP